MDLLLFLCKKEWRRYKMRSSNRMARREKHWDFTVESMRDGCDSTWQMSHRCCASWTMCDIKILTRATLTTRLSPRVIRHSDIRAFTENWQHIHTTLHINILKQTCWNHEEEQQEHRANIQPDMENSRNPSAINTDHVRCVSAKCNVSGITVREGLCKYSI